jgi:subfamily B ATP-binding cassette protein MsbA
MMQRRKTQIENQAYMSLPSKSLVIRISKLLPYFLSPRKYWASAVFFTIVMALTEPLIPALLQPLLDQGFKNNNFPLWLIPCSIIGIFAVKGLSNFIALMSLAKIANSGVLMIREKLFSKLLIADFLLFRKESASALSNTMAHEIQGGSMQLVHSTLTVARDGLTLLGLIGYLLYINWKLTLLVACIFPAVALVMKFLTKRLYLVAKQGQATTEQMAYVIEENVLAHKDIRLYAAQSAQTERFRALGHQLNRIFYKSTAASAAMTPLTQFFASVALAAVVTIALSQSSTHGTTVGQFASFVMAMLMLIAPIKHLSEVSGQITRGMVAIERGIELIENTQEEQGGNHCASKVLGYLEFENVSVEFDTRSAKALDNISLKVRPGESIALVGTSGAGKTTLVNLIPRFIVPSAGKITLDGIPLEEWNLSNLRAHIGIVSQHVFLLNDSIAANISLGTEQNEEMIYRALDASNLLDYVNALPNGIHTILGHNAMQLSGGQRQRLAIARAIYKDAPILILDEATSALDNESERFVKDAVTRLMANRTTIIVAHRLSTIQHVAHIVVMNGGKVVETGNHAELLSISGHYKNLYELGLA